MTDGGREPIPIPITRPTLGPEEEAAVAEVLRSGWVGQGPRTAAFEARLAEITGAPHALATSSGTTALHLALLALGLGPGDEVVVPASSFIATANAVRMVGAAPVFADVDLATCNLDPADATQRIGPRTRALLVAHQLGHPADLDGCRDLCAAHGLRLVEDAACALGSRYGDAPVGRPHGDVACFSFHPRKVLTTGEGGALTTADPALDDRLRRLRNHGAVATGQPAHAPGSVVYPDLGYNFRLSDLQAAVGLVQLDRLEALVARRQALAALYTERLRDHPALALPAPRPNTESNWQSYQVLLTDACAGSPREVADALAHQGIATRSGLTAIHREPLYLAADATGPALPHAERIAARGLFIPLFPDLSDAQAHRVCDALLEATGPPVGS